MSEPLQQPLTVLVVDDIVSNAKLLALIMENMFKAQVSIAYSGKVALDLLNNATPRLLMIDINMPNMDGYTLLEEIRALPALAASPVVAVSANALPEDVMRGLQAGFAAYITKPYDFDDVWQTVCPLLGLDPNTRAAR
jgi:CheY-like chemotaxis protein